MSGIITIGPVRSKAQKAEIARLIYAKDTEYVPVTPLATLSSSTTFLMATMQGDEAIKAASSYDFWLGGCDAKKKLGCDVYELASSLVRDPMGGFTPTALHHIFTFARLVEIVSSYLSPESKTKISIVSSIAAGNSKSQDNMKAIGMVPIDPWPPWLTYEHRTWFPKLTKEERRPEKEATYFWFPPAAIKSFMITTANHAAGKVPLTRPAKGKPAITEQFMIKMDGLVGYQDLIGHFDDSLDKAVNGIPYADLFIAPPPLATFAQEPAGTLDTEFTF